MDDAEALTASRTRSPYRRFLPVIRLPALACLLALMWVVTSASPAHAHGVGGVEPRNYESRLLRVEPALAGVGLEVVDLGDALRLTNRSRHDVVVIGYDGEPYLRVGPRGVFENTRSPATYLNRSLVPTEPAPRGADPRAAPSWRKVSSTPVATWHDHRVHHMGSTDPAIVQRDPSARHLVDRWTIELRAGDRTARATGELVWVPPPSPWPWVGLAVAIAAAVLVLGRSRAWRPALVLGLGALVVAELVHVVGGWDAAVASSGSKLGASAYSLAGIVCGLLALAWAWRRGLDTATPLVLIAAVTLFVAGGLADVAALGHSQVATALPPGVARLLVALALGLGAGLGASAALRLRRGEAPPRSVHPVARAESPAVR